MNALKILRYITAALALGGLGVTCVPAANAVALYGADALVQITLTGGTLGSNVFVSYENQVTGQEATASGLTSFAVADPVIFPGQPPADMPFSNTIEQDHIAVGEAGGPYGTAYSSLQSAGYIYIDNQSGASVDLTFEYSIRANVYVGLTGNPGFADAFAEAIVEIFDDTFAFVDIYETLSASLATGVTNQKLDPSGTFRITVADGSFSNLSVFVDTYGGATYYVPEPGSIWLIGSGLTLLAFRRRAAA